MLFNSVAANAIMFCDKLMVPQLVTSSHKSCFFFTFVFLLLKLALVEGVMLPSKHRMVMAEVDVCWPSLQHCKG